MMELQLRQSAVKVMQGWLGGKQGSAIHRDIVDTYNSYLPHPRGHALTMSDAWCAGTVSAAAIRAGLTDIMPVECSCSKLIELYKGLGRWVEDDSHVPMPGDLVIYDWEDTGKGDNVGQPDHVGMVETVVGTSMQIIEGNYNNMVQRRTLKVNGRYIRGYCCPDYAAKAAALTPTPAPTPEVSGLKTYTHLSDVPSWYQPSVRKAMELGALTGGSDPDPASLEDNVLNVSEDLCRMITVLDRLELLDK